MHDKTIIYPSYLINKELYVNESRDGTKKLEFIQGTGLISRHPETITDTDRLLYWNNQKLKVEEDLSTIDFTLEVSFKRGSGTVTLFNFIGDNKVTSNTTLNVSSNHITIYFWNTYHQLELKRYESLINSDEFVNYTLVRVGGRLRHFINGVLVWTYSIGNRFDSKNFTLMGGNFRLRKWSLTPYVTLPQELMLKDSSKLFTKDSVMKYVNISTDIYDLSSYSTPALEKLYSYSNWIFALYNTGEILAFYRPRGLDKGVSIKSASYHYGREELTIVDDNDVNYVIAAPILETSAEPTPGGVGVLSTDNVHKELVAGNGVFLGKKKPLASVLNPDANLAESLYLDSSILKATYIDYSKRLLIEEVITLNIGSLNPTATNAGFVKSAIVKCRSSDLDVFDVMDNVATIKPGKYLVRGLINRGGLTASVFAIELRGSKSVLYSTAWPSKNTWSNIYSFHHQFSFEDVIEVIEEQTVELFQLLFAKDSTYTATSAAVAPIVISRIELFKI